MIDEHIPRAQCYANNAFFSMEDEKKKQIANQYEY